MDEQTNTSTPAPAADTSVAPAANTATPATATATSGLRAQAMWYAIAFVGVLVVAAVLWFMLEREGRVSTSVFSSITALVERSQPVALVNGVEIDRVDFDNNLLQLTNNAAQQGLDVTDETVVTELRTQAIETLVNTEVLRQAAVDASHVATPELIEARYKEIEQGIGGPEALVARMAELQVTEAMLRRDIENDIVIQALIDAEVDLTSVTVTDEEMRTLYEQAGGAAAGLPPFEEVKTQVEEQVRFQKEQELVAEYVNALRGSAEVEVLI